jgi:hypothetical protein
MSKKNNKSIKARAHAHDLLSEQQRAKSARGDEGGGHVLCAALDRAHAGLFAPAPLSPLAMQRSDSGAAPPHPPPAQWSSARGRSWPSRPRRTSARVHGASSARLRRVALPRRTRRRPTASARACRSRWAGWGRWAGPCCWRCGGSGEGGNAVEVGSGHGGRGAAVKCRASRTRPFLAAPRLARAPPAWAHLCRAAMARGCMLVRCLL